MKTIKMILSILLSVVILVVAQLASQLLASAILVIGVPEFVCNVIAGILYIVFAYLLLKLLCNKYLKEDMSEYRIPRFKMDIKWVIVAIVLPVAVSAFYLLFMDGEYVSNDVDTMSKLTLVSANIFFIGLGAGIVEEMVFRGIMMSAIEKRFSKKIAIIVPSVLFGVVHILGMDFDFLSCVLVILAGTMVGIMFSLIASETNSIWNSAIVHAVWNMVVESLEIGIEFDEYALGSYVLESESFILTGGEFGIESSLVAVIGYCVVSLLVVMQARKNGYCKE